MKCLLRLQPGNKGFVRHIKWMDGCQQLHFSPVRLLRSGVGGLVRLSSRLHASSPCTCSLPVFTHRKQFSAGLLLCLYLRNAFKTVLNLRPSSGRLTFTQSHNFRWVHLLDVTSLDSSWSVNCISFILLSNTRISQHSSIMNSFFLTSEKND